MKFEILFKNLPLHSGRMTKTRKVLTYFCTSSKIKFFFCSCFSIPSNHWHCITSIFLLYFSRFSIICIYGECPKWTYGRRHISGCLQSITFEELFLTKTKYFSLLLTKRKWIKRRNFFFRMNFSKMWADLLLCFVWMGVSSIENMRWSSGITFFCCHFVCRTFTSA